MGGETGAFAGTPTVMRLRGMRLWQPPATRTGLKWDSLSGQGLRWLGWEKPSEVCVDMSSAGWGPVSVPLSHTGEESEWRLVVGRQRRLWEVESGPLSQGEVKGNRKVQVAGVKGHPGEEKALVA